MKKLFVLTIFLILFSCKKESEEVKMLVTSSYGDVYVNEIKNAHIGLILSQGDIIRTENGKVSVQSRDGATVLVKEFSKIRISELNKLSTEVDVTNGSLLIRVNKLGTNSKFNVRTPTAVAGIRGTTFFVYSSKESTIVNSVEGSVAVGKPNTQGMVIEKSSVEVSNSGQRVMSESYIPNIVEVTDIITLVNISPENINGALNGDTKEFENEVNLKTKKAESDAIEIIRSPNFSSSKNSEVIKSVIVLKNGDRIRGNVIYQTRDKVFVISENKQIQEIEKSTVSSIDFL